MTRLTENMMQAENTAIAGMQRCTLKTEIVFGPSAFDRLQAFRGQRVCFVTDAFMVKSGAVAKVQSRLPDCEIAVFDEVVSDPTLDVIAKGVRSLAAFRPDVVIALGGGSPIDAAKAIVATLRDVSASCRIILVAIPTTSGTGSEVTAFSVITEAERGIKHTLRSEQITPDIALLAPQLVLTVPPHVTADTGMDVITHAIEACVAPGASALTDAFAEKALKLAFRNLPAAFSDGQNLPARSAMHYASCMAGMAFNASGLGLNHGLAHAIGARMHIAHGRINALLLPLVIEYNAGTLDGVAAPNPVATRYAELARELEIESPSVRAGVKNLARAVTRLNGQIGIPATVRALGADMAEYVRHETEMVESALSDASTASNPRKPTRQDIVQLIRLVAGR